VTSIEAIAADLRGHGYAIVRGLMPRAACDAVRAAFAAEVREHAGPLLRQDSGRAEPHRFGPGGHVTNALLGIQDLDAARFGGFVAAGLAVAGHPALVALVRGILEQPPALVETMYFESSNGNGVHADAPYMDAAPPGRMIGAWIALEDIAAEAGRFFVYPRSHLLGTGALAGAEAYHAYEAVVIATSRAARGRDPVRIAAERVDARRRIARVIAAAGLSPIAPALAMGDVLVWDARTLHGSAAPARDDRTRHSITAHYLGAGDTYLVHGAPRPLRLRAMAELAIHLRGPAPA
jgi:phytanoyl-CoA hydroxylase